MCKLYRFKENGKPKENHLIATKANRIGQHVEKTFFLVVCGFLIMKLF